MFRPPGGGILGFLLYSPARTESTLDPSSKRNAPRRRARSSLLYSPAQDEGHNKWPSLRAELAMNFVPAAREGAPLLMEGLIGRWFRARMRPKWDGLSGWAGFRKMRPGICLWNGT